MKTENKISKIRSVLYSCQNYEQAETALNWIEKMKANRPESKQKIKNALPLYKKHGLIREALDMFKYQLTKG